VKCDPEKAIELREKFSCVLPGYHMNKRHWNTIICDGSSNRQQIQEWIDDSYHLVVSSLTKKLKTQLESL
jgi:predicted DNA-binding protein (MmcQ/YjbR family)